MKPITKYLALIIVAILGVVVAGPSFAEEKTDMLFVPGNTLGELSSATSVNVYYLEATEPQVISLEILTLTDRYSSSFAVYNSDGEAMPVIADAMSGWGIDMKVTLPEAGIYRILVGALDAGYGSYLLRVTEIGSYENHEYGLVLDTGVEASISGTQQMHRYNFTAQPTQALTLYVVSDINNPGLSLSLTNQSQSQEAGAMDNPVGASSFCIPAGTDTYNLDLMSARNSEESQYSLFLVSDATENCAQTLAFAELEAAFGTNNPGTDSANGKLANSSTVGNTGNGIDNRAESSTYQYDNPDDESTADACDTTSVALSAAVANAADCLDVSLRLGDGEVAANVCDELDANVVKIDASLDACVDANIDMADGEVAANACDELAADGEEIAVDIDACVDVSLSSDGLEADVDVEANVNAIPVNVNANVNTNSGTTAPVVNANATTNPGSTEPIVNVDVNATEPIANVDVNTNSGNTEPIVNVEINTNPANTAPIVNLGVNLPKLP